MLPDLRRFRFWVHDYAPLPATSAVQVVVVIAIIVGLVLGIPLAGSFDLWTLALVVACVPIVVVGVVFLRRARYVAPKRRMVVTGAVAGFLVGVGCQLLLSPG